jgi:prepilin-type N-terminal cleavage/methylation domain-containing protein
MRGFTLIEILIVMFIIVFLVGVIIFFVISLSNYRTFFLFTMGSEKEIDIMLTNIAREIRTMNYSSNGAYPIEYASTTSIIFYSDIDNDGLTERIRYYLENNILKRGIIKPSGTPPSYNQANEKIWNMVYNVEDFKITYYDESLNILSPPIENYKIKIIKVEVKTKPVFNKPSIQSYIVVSPRNLKTK